MITSIQNNFKTEDLFQSAMLLWNNEWLTKINEKTCFCCKISNYSRFNNNSQYSKLISSAVKLSECIEIHVNIYSNWISWSLLFKLKFHRRKKMNICAFVWQSSENATMSSMCNQLNKVIHQTRKANTRFRHSQNSILRNRIWTPCCWKCSNLKRKFNALHNNNNFRPKCKCITFNEQ